MTSTNATNPTKFFRRVFFACITIGGTVSFAPGADPAIKPVNSEVRITSTRRDALVDVVERVKSAVVNIHSERTVASDSPFKNEPQRMNGMGTGIVIDPRGYLITNHHVIDDVQSLRVRLIDGTSLNARVLATDKQSDLALVKIDPPSQLPLAPLGTASDLFLAEQVIAIGNAYGYEHTVTVGFVSAKNRDVTLNKEVSYQALIQTQTPINPGNSGGPLFNKKGELVGVNVAIRAGAQNIAFAIPVDSMISKATDLLASKRKVAVRHGLVLQDRVVRDGEEGGVKRWVAVAHVEPNSIAAAAGFKAGDIVEKAGDIPVNTTIDIERSFIDQPSNGRVNFVVNRNSKQENCLLSFMPGSTQNQNMTATAVAPPAANTPADMIWKKLGIKATAVGANTVASIDPQLRGGMYLTEIATGSAASRSGLVKGDVLIGMHLWEALSTENIVYVLEHKDLPKIVPIKTYYVRGGKLREAFITPEN
jgi:serine protease Do